MDSKQGQRIHIRGGSDVADKLIKAMEGTEVKEEFIFGDVSIIVTRDHILSSQCHHPETVSNNWEKCQVCEYTHMLKLPHLPEMIFPNNSVVITYSNEPELRISFNALDALKSVDVTSYPDVEIEPSEKWQQSRNDVNRFRRGSQRPFDWTYTSDYKGTVEGYTVVPTDEAISVEKLKRRDPISFYSQLTLYEDELADHGCSEMSIRLRAMPTCLFLLCRFYLRIDGVLVRICDTRLYKELNSDTFLRQWTRREVKLANSSPVVRSNVLDPDVIYDYLPTVAEEMTKLIPL
uniref:TIP41-like protein n=1 Tax=Onchocerca volvulus TaxID=6282 RepID=A0A8R1TTB3_ONCVO